MGNYRLFPYVALSPSQVAVWAIYSAASGNPVIGASLFAVGSLIASFSYSVGMLLLGESIIKGIGAALMMPATSSLLVSTYWGKDRAIALGLWGGMAAAGSAIGSVLGGLLHGSV